MFNKIKELMLTTTIKVTGLLGAVSFLPTKILADDPTTNPWASATTVTTDNIQATVDTKMSSTLSAILIVGGVGLVAGGIGLFISILNKSAEEKKDDGAFKSIMSILIGILLVVVGLILVGLGFTGIKALSQG